MNAPDATPDHEGYRGPALLVTATDALEVLADVRGHFEPVDGRYHWQGRIDGDLHDLVGRRHDAVLVTPDGQARCVVTDVDLWGRLAVRGRGRPPFDPGLAELPAA